MGDVLPWSLVGLLAVVMAAMVTRRVRTPESPTNRPIRSEPSMDLGYLVLEQAGEGVIVLSETLTPVMANATARAMLGFAPDTLPATLRSDELLSLARRALSEDASVEAGITLWPRRLSVQVKALPLQEHRGVAIFMQDVTDETRLQQVRRQFVVNASHELKTPVTGLLALGEAVRDAIPEDIEGARRLTQQLIREAERLSKLSQDLLDLSRVEDPSTLRSASIDLQSIAEHEAASLSDLAREHDIAIEIERVDSSAEVRGDPQQLGLMIRNLIDNAIRYSDPGDRVGVEVEADNEEVVLRVTDNGIGIPLRDQARVFERFYRVDEGRSRASGGTGLGLSIVRHVAESHGGHVALESELGEGSRFIVRLPRTLNGAR